jgi:proteic killer suppression protein
MLHLSMIQSFRHKDLAELFERGHSRRVQQSLQARCLRRLEALDQAESLTDLNVPGFNFHGLQGLPKRYSIHVNGPWCITRLTGKARKRYWSILSNIIKGKLWLSILSTVR